MKSVRAKVITAAVIAAVAATLAAGLYLVYGRERGNHGVKLDTARFPIRGIDISAHNGTIDFDKVADDDIEFVLIKATEGGTFKDSRFHDNYRRARDAGLRLGAYHFFRFDVDGEMQGLNFVHSVRGKRLDLPLIIDIEEYNNARNVPTDTIISRLGRMLSIAGEGRWTMWQYSHWGRVEGCNGVVDLNTFNGDSAAWRRHIAITQ